MVNGPKYQLEIQIASGGNMTDEEISRVGKALADGAELNVTDDSAVEGVTVTKLSVEVTKTVDLLEEDEGDLQEV